MKQYFILFIIILSFSSNPVIARWTSQTSGTSNRLLSVFLINANYGWAVGVGGVIVKNDNAGLPVELSFFKGNYFNNNVNLFWRTETEVNN